MNTHSIKKTVIEGTSLYEDVTHRTYIGDLNIEAYNKRINEKGIFVRQFKAFDTPQTKMFVDNRENAIAVNRIEGIQFLAGAIPADGMFKPIDVGSISTRCNYPLYNFITTPPDGSKMWTLSYYRNSQIVDIKIVISTKYKNDTQHKIHRAPLPNLNFPNASLCMGNAMRGENAELNITKSEDKIRNIMRSGWNNDWHKNEVYFVEKDDNTMKIRWHKPIIQIGECVLITDEKIVSIINMLENETNNRDKIKTTYLDINKEDYEQIKQNRESTNPANETEQENTNNGEAEQSPVQNIPEPNQEVQNRETQNTTETEENRPTIRITRNPLPPSQDVLEDARTLMNGPMEITPELPVPPTIDLRGDQQ